MTRRVSRAGLAAGFAIFVGAAWAAPGSDALLAEFPKSELRRFLGRAAEAADRGDYAEATARWRIFADAWAASPRAEAAPEVGNAHARRDPRATFAVDFFSWRDGFHALRVLDRLDRLDPALRAAAQEIARESVRPMERGPNNRSYHYAWGALDAATLFPGLPGAATWRAYAEAVWQDWWRLSDGFEPGYVAHHLPQVIALGEALGHLDALRSPRARATFHNFRDHVSARGRARVPADPGGPGDETDYVAGLAAAACVTNDGTLLDAAQRALAATPGNFPGRDRLARLVAEAAVELTPVSPASLATVQHLYPASVRQPDRLLLSLVEAPDQPYAGLYLNDSTETLFHGHEDHRGDVYHYEVDGVVYLRGSDWAKGVGTANTFVVAPATADFPEPLARPLPRGQLLRASADVRPLRYFQEGEGWVRDRTAPTDQYQRSLLAPDGLGYAWANPHSLAGGHDVISPKTVTLRFLSIPPEEARRAVEKKDGYLGSLSFDPAFFWYREYRAAAASDGPLEVRVHPLRLAGTAGGKLLRDFERLPEATRVTHYAPGTRGQPGRELAPAEARALVQAEAGALRVTCPAGRMDVELPVNLGNFDLVREFSRIEFDYEILSDTSALYRAPLAVALDGLRPRSVYIDHQQGGSLLSAHATKQAGDAAGQAEYRDVFAAGAQWTRRILLTREGVLVALDRYTTAPGQGDVSGGPVWHLAVPPEPVESGFVAAAAGRPDRRLRVQFHLEPGEHAGRQVQPRFSAATAHAVFVRRPLVAGRPAHFLSVLAPESLGRAVTTVAADGAAQIEFVHLGIELRADGSWSVARR